MSQFFGKADHSGFVVPDIDQAMQRMLDSGIGPCYVMRRIRVPARYCGVRNDILISAAFVYAGDKQFEFIQQHDDTPSVYRDYIEQHPEGGLQHLAYFCHDSFEQTLQRAADRGTTFNISQEFITPDEVAYEIYVQPDQVTDPLLVQLMIPGPLQPVFDQIEEATANWDGSDPIRDVLQLIPEAMRPPTES